MAGIPTPIYPQTIKDYTAVLVNGTGTTLLTLVTGGSNGSKVESLIITSTDTSGHDIQIWKTISAVNYLVGTVSVPAASGNASATVGINALAGGPTANIPGICVDSNGNNYLYVANGTTLSVAAAVTVTSGKNVYCIASGGDY